MQLYWNPNRYVHYILPICGTHNASNTWDHPPSYLLTQPLAFANIEAHPLLQVNATGPVLQSYLSESTSPADIHEQITEGSGLAPLGYSTEEELLKIIDEETEEAARSIYEKMANKAEEGLRKAALDLIKTSLEEAETRLDDFSEQACEPIALSNWKSWIPIYGEVTAYYTLTELESNVMALFCQEARRSILEGLPNLKNTHVDLLDKTVEDKLNSTELDSTVDEICAKVVDKLTSA